MNDEQLLLVRLLSCGLRQKPLTGQETAQFHKTDEKLWAKTLRLALDHKTAPLLYDVLEQLEEEGACAGLTGQIREQTLTTVRQCFRLLYLDRQLLAAFAHAGIRVVLLKGMGTAGFYPNPLYRKSGDVDLLLPDGEMLMPACEVLRKLGLAECGVQPSLHHVVFAGADGIEVELHTMLAEPFDEERVNQILQKQLEAFGDFAEKREVLGISLDVLKDSCHAYELLLHMLQHFLRSGFGLKLLCDWVVFWRRDVPEAEKEHYLGLVRECGIRRFSDLVTAVCVEYLGLEEEYVAFMDAGGKGKRFCFSKGDLESFLSEIMVAEEFGKSSKDRMVALRGDSVFDYVREFHHQMHLNFPKAGRVFVFWPALWCVTLARFLVNNRKIRGVSLGAVLKKAGQRGKLMKNLELFKKG